MPKPDLAARYADLQAAAAQVNHQVRVVVIPGAKLSVGQTLTVKPLDVDPMDLEAALAAQETYLASDEARQRGDLYLARDAAHQAYLDALNDMNAKRKAWRDAEDAVDQDLDGALYPQAADDEPVTMTAGDLRKALAGDDRPEAQAALERIASLADDAQVNVEPDDLPAK